MPRLKKKELDSREVTAPQREGVISALEDPPSIETESLEVAEGPDIKDKAKALAFMEEKLMILIHPSHEPKPEDPVYVSVNGRGAYIWRNQKTIVPRKYVEVLARAKQDNISQDVNAKDPDMVNRLTIAPVQRYPFSVLQDSNPDGPAWLNKILSEAN